MDSPTQRKTESYVAGEVKAGRADWVDQEDHSQGILCRAFLYNGERIGPAAPRNNKRVPGPAGVNFGSGEVEGTHFRQPSDPLWQEQHGPASHSLRTRASMSLKAWKRQFAV